MEKVQHISSSQEFPKREVPAYLVNIAAREAETLAIMEELGIEVRHFNTENQHKGGVTIAYQYIQGNSYVTIATSLCSKNDSYDKKIGRTLAVENFVSGKTVNIPYSDNTEDCSPGNYIGGLFQYFKLRY